MKLFHQIASAIAGLFAPERTPFDNIALVTDIDRNEDRDGGPSTAPDGGGGRVLVAAGHQA